MVDKANADMEAFWNGEGGNKWVSHEDRLETSLQPFGARAIEASAVQADENILEIGCGCGPNTIELARRLRAGGNVRGVDISATVLEAARKNAEASGLTNIVFNCADAQTSDLGSEAYNLAFSRFGVMFFDDPVSAFKNIRGALKSDGRLAFASWAAADKNPWVAQPLQAVAKHIPLPPPPKPGTPGPFSLGSEQRVQEILNEAGFSNIVVETFQTPMVLGDNISEAVNFLMQMAPSGGAISAADPDESTRAAIAEDLASLLSSCESPDGIAMDAVALMVTADRG